MHNHTCISYIYIYICTYIRHVYAVYSSCSVYITYYYTIMCVYDRVRTIRARGTPVHTESRVSAAILLPGQWHSLVPHTTAVCRTIINEKVKENHCDPLCVMIIILYPSYKHMIYV